jgi:hypothetical protein
MTRTGRGLERSFEIHLPQIIRVGSLKALPGQSPFAFRVGNLLVTV